MQSAPAPEEALSTASRPQPARRRSRPRLRAARAALLGLLWVAWLVGGPPGPPPAAAQENGAAPKDTAAAPKDSATPPSASGSPEVHLDKLLKLPSNESYTIEKRGGLSRGEWQQMFAELRRRLAAEKKALAADESKMDKVAKGANPWKVGPSIPGMTDNSGDAPLDYQLQRVIKVRRQRVHGLQEQLRQLGIKADLAGVPPDWRS